MTGASSRYDDTDEPLPLLRDDSMFPGGRVVYETETFDIEDFRTLARKSGLVVIPDEATFKVRGHGVSGSFDSYEQWYGRYISPPPRSVETLDTEAIRELLGHLPDALSSFKVRRDSLFRGRPGDAGGSGVRSGDPEPRADSVSVSQEEVQSHPQSSQDGEQAPRMGGSQEGSR